MTNNFLKDELSGNKYKEEVLTKQWVAYYNNIIGVDFGNEKIGLY